MYVPLSCALWCWPGKRPLRNPPFSVHNPPFSLQHSSFVVNDPPFFSTTFPILSMNHIPHFKHESHLASRYTATSHTHGPQPTMGKAAVAGSLPPRPIRFLPSAAPTRTVRGSSPHHLPRVRRTRVAVTLVAVTMGLLPPPADHVNNAKSIIVNTEFIISYAEFIIFNANRDLFAYRYLRPACTHLTR